MSNVPEKSQEDRKAVAAQIAAAGRLLLTTHARPDGDALGSVLALHLACQAAGKESSILLLDEVPRRYQFLFDNLALPPRPADLNAAFEEAAAQADKIVVLDTCSIGQLKPIAPGLAKVRQKVIVIDHHATADDLTSCYWRDASYSAVGGMVVDLLEELGWPLTPAVAQPLMTAIVTDTGWMHYSNTDARTLRCLAKLIGAGMKPDVLYARLYQCDRPQRVRLLSAALDSLELHADDRLAMMVLTLDDFARTGAGQDETEDFASEPLRIASVELAVTLIEQGGGEVRANLRSRGVVDVSMLARMFGGGGHARAAGFRSREGLTALEAALLELGTAALTAGDSKSTDCTD
jgi:phosphoesterase RecJ-like protein